MRISFGSKKNLGPRLIANALIRHGITWSKSRITILHGAVSFSRHKGITRQRHGKEQNPCKKKVACNMSLRPTKCWVCLTWRVSVGGGSIFPFPRLSHKQPRSPEAMASWPAPGMDWQKAKWWMAWKESDSAVSAPWWVVFEETEISRLLANDTSFNNKKDPRSCKWCWDVVTGPQMLT